MRTDPNSISDDVADAAQIEFHEFIYGWEEPLTRRQLGFLRQAWKCAISVAVDKLSETPYPSTNDERGRTK